MNGIISETEKQSFQAKLITTEAVGVAIIILLIRLVSDVVVNREFQTPKFLVSGFARMTLIRLSSLIYVVKDLTRKTLLVL